MSIYSFLKLVEIQTKVASVIPFLLGTVYAVYRFNTFNLKNFLLMLVALLAIDMATTAINNYYDYKRAKRVHGFNYENHNAIVRDKLKESTVIVVIFMLLGTATVFGFILFLNTNLVVLFLGAVSFIIGVLYSFGPVPISRTPFGELFSGLFMGMIIPFIAVYIHVFDQNLAFIIYAQGILSFGINIVEVFYVFIVALPAVCGIANIMLANNICDIEDDIENKRYTLPIHIGNERAVELFKLLYILSYVAIIIAIILKVIPLVSALLYITLFSVIKNIKAFSIKQSKAETFALSVKNFIVINVVHIFLVLLGIGFTHL